MLGRFDYPDQRFTMSSYNTDRNSPFGQWPQQQQHTVTGPARTQMSGQFSFDNDEQLLPWVDEDFQEHAVDLAAAAPPQHVWYHGRMDRFEAERRLQASRRLGSYLVRQSDHKVNCYVLSFLGQNGLNHFRITSVCGDYYIGGRKFGSLLQLVGFYTTYSDLLKNEKLSHPVPPPQPVAEHQKVVAVLPYTRLPDSDELSFLKGDILLVINDIDDAWLWCESHRTHESGLVFKDLVEELDDKVDPNEMFPWFHGNLSKDRASELLSRMGPGSFLVKASERSPGNYSLFFYINCTVQRFRISKLGSKYIMGGNKFNNLEEVIVRYHSDQIVEGYTLGDPVLKPPFLKSRPISRKKSSTLNTTISTQMTINGPDVYQTLRESRELAEKKKPESTHGYLWINKNGKKWKRYFFKLETDAQHLAYYVNERRVKPKGLIDLYNGCLYTVHDSMFEKPFCFMLYEKSYAHLSAVSSYLCAETAEQAKEWVQALQPRCTPQKAKKERAVPAIEVRTLHVTVTEARRLPVKLMPHPYCIVTLNDVRICRTQVKCPPAPVWDDNFVLDIPNDVTSFSIILCNDGKKSKETEVSNVVVNLTDLKNGEETDEWYKLSGINPPPRDEWGSIRLKIRYSDQTVLPVKEYWALKDLLFNPDLEVISVLESLCHRDRVPLANALLQVYRFQSESEGILLKALIEREIKQETETTQLFRAGSLASTIMDLYMKETCQDYLEAALREPLRKVLENKKPCEVDPRKQKDLARACANAEMLVSLVNDVFDWIIHSVESCPPTLRFLCGCLQRSVSAKWPDDKLIKSRVVSGFIFLRLLCPALLNPLEYRLLDDAPPDAPSRALYLISKSLLSLANLVDLGQKEPWMEVVNPFIVANKAKMIKYLDDIAMVNELPNPIKATNEDSSRHLATIHSICERYRMEIVNLSHDRATLRKLIAVTDHLSKLKQGYKDDR
ncbi:Ras GTPase-activating protein 1 [Halotydeus destructor]|nr:Ras GTPase-activating protein 1 [Halotydeus destructor]